MLLGPERQSSAFVLASCNRAILRLNLFEAMKGIGTRLQLAQSRLQLLRFQRLPTGLQKAAEGCRGPQLRPAATPPSASRPKDLLLGFCDPSSLFDGRELDMNRPRPPWRADPIHHKPNGDHIAHLGGFYGLPGDCLPSPSSNASMASVAR